MGSLSNLAREPRVMPAAIAWFLSDLGEARGKQELFTRQSPEKLEALRRHALVESAVSSNRIEGVEIEPSRIEAVMFGRAALKDRDEEEVRGYRDALKLIHEKGANLPISEDTVRDLQRACPEVSVDLIRAVLKDLRSKRRVECLGRGSAATWRRTGKW